MEQSSGSCNFQRWSLLPKAICRCLNNLHIFPLFVNSQNLFRFFSKKIQLTYLNRKYTNEDLTFYPYSFLYNCSPRSAVQLWFAFWFLDRKFIYWNENKTFQSYQIENIIMYLNLWSVAGALIRKYYVISLSAFLVIFSSSVPLI